MRLYPFLFDITVPNYQRLKSVHTSFCRLDGLDPLALYMFLLRKLHKLLTPFTTDSLWGIELLIESFQ